MMQPPNQPYLGSLLKHNSQRRKAPYAINRYEKHWEKIYEAVCSRIESGTLPGLSQASYVIEAK
jgi:hypothetical protein